MSDRRFLTEFDQPDGVYAGPIILAETQIEAEAIVTTCVRGPNGQILRVMGELVQSMPCANGDTEAVLRRRLS